MDVTITSRGFERIDLLHHDNNPEMRRLVGQSSAVGKDDRPGSSFLWVGSDHHLNRKQVAELIEHLQAWVNTGSLVIGLVETNE